MAATSETAVDVIAEVDDRDRRAAEEAMAVMPLADGLYRVYSGGDAAYVVDLRGPACECGDWQYREPEGGCKHARRVLMTIGQQAIPNEVRVDPTLTAQRDRLTGEDGGAR
jgi:hypothetical protein